MGRGAPSSSMNLEGGDSAENMTRGGQCSSERSSFHRGPSDPPRRPAARPALAVLWLGNGASFKGWQRWTVGGRPPESISGGGQTYAGTALWQRRWGWVGFANKRESVCTHARGSSGRRSSRTHLPWGPFPEQPLPANPKPFLLLGGGTEQLGSNVAPIFFGGGGGQSGGLSVLLSPQVPSFQEKSISL